MMHIVRARKHTATRPQHIPVVWCLKCLHSCSQSDRAPWRPATERTAWAQLGLNSWTASNSLQEGKLLIYKAMKDQMTLHPLV